MSSSYVRTQIKNFFATELPTEKLVDLTAQWGTMDDLLDEFNVGRNDNWIGLQFIGNDEMPIDLAADNLDGCYREYGSILVHVVGVAALGVGDNILSRSEIIRNKLRGRRIGNIVIKSVTPPNFEVGATLRFESGFVSATITVDYTNDINL